MKKINKLVISFLIAILSCNIIFASTTTYVRTKENLQIAEDIKITTKVIDSALKTPKVDEKEKIYDFANLLSSTEESELLEEVLEYIQDYNMDMIIVTTNNNNKSDAQNYADDFYDYNYFGVSDTHDGILFLIDMDTREMWISTAGKAQLIYDDARIDRMLDNTYNYISAKKYYSTANVFISNAKEYAKNGIPNSNKNAYIDENGEYIYNRRNYSQQKEFPILLVVILPIAISFAFVGIASLAHRKIRKAVDAKEYLNKDDIELFINEDQFISTNTTKVKIQTSSGGGYRGGSSTHHSSSGRSHGGGGRRF